MNTPTSTTTPKPGFLSGFNLNSVLLFIVIILLGVVVCKPEPKVKAAPPPIHASIRDVEPAKHASIRDAKPAKIEYQYATVHVSRRILGIALATAEKRDEKYSRLGFHIPDGWEYAGPLCDDGTDGAFILIRRPKP